jgi:hypothetical protein
MDGSNGSQIPTPIKRMDLNEFVDKGFLQEANRLFFHPLGLALEAVTDDKNKDKVIRLGGVWDFRDDPEGIVYEFDNEKAKKVFISKAVDVEEERQKHYDARCLIFGGQPIQPLPMEGSKDG